MQNLTQEVNKQSCDAVVAALTHAGADHMLAVKIHKVLVDAGVIYRIQPFLLTKRHRVKPRRKAVWGCMTCLPDLVFCKLDVALSDDALQDSHSNYAAARLSSRAMSESGVRAV